MLKMGSREEILSRIAKVKPTGNELPEDLSFISGTGIYWSLLYKQPGIMVRRLHL